jgi:hypothetical protein
MSFPTRHLAPVLAVLAATMTFTQMTFTHSAAADPDIDTESAAAVIEELQEQGYVVNVNGVPSGNTALLTTCKVTTINNPTTAAPSPAGTTTISVDVACPIQR